ncbi:nipped-b-like protein [Limosa lapponica baueri]|uniref:Nipped-b-like protein n=1 Tax=Limosa lapponica baueri TaxID=1758121 RepID=A0A2I0UP13_LIMLA|nr:nipped-b-like protein [Limosa lapponica baueri]
METPERGLVGNGAHTHKKMLKPLARLKCIYTNACSMNNKQGELEAMMHQENYDIVAIAETWWDASHDWSATNEGYKLFRRDRQERRGGGVAAYVSECYESSEIKYSDNRVESVWIRIRANKGYIAVGVCYRPPNQSSEVDEAFYKQLGEILKSFAIVLVGDFNLPDICWEYNTADREQFRRFLECVEDNFLMQLISELTRESALLDLLLVNREELVGEVEVGGRLGHSDHEMIEFSILGETRRKAVRIVFQNKSSRTVITITVEEVATVQTIPSEMILCIFNSIYSTSLYFHSTGFDKISELKNAGMIERSSVKLRMNSLTVIMAINKKLIISGRSKSLTEEKGLSSVGKGSLGELCSIFDFMEELLSPDELAPDSRVLHR